MTDDRDDHREQDDTPGQKHNPRTPQNEERRNREDHTVLKRMNGEEEEAENTTKHPDEITQQVKANEID